MGFAAGARRAAAALRRAGSLLRPASPPIRSARPLLRRPVLSLHPPCSPSGRAVLVVLRVIVVGSPHRVVRPATHRIRPARDLLGPATDLRAGSPLLRHATLLLRPARPLLGPATDDLLRAGSSLLRHATPLLRPARPLIGPATPLLRPARPLIGPATPLLRPGCPLLRPATSVSGLADTRAKDCEPYISKISRQLDAMDKDIKELTVRNSEIGDAIQKIAAKQAEEPKRDWGSIKIFGRPLNLPGIASLAWRILDKIKG